MNDDTEMLYQGMENDEIIYDEMESAARYAGAVSGDQIEFHDVLAGEIERIANENRDVLPGFSLTEGIDYSLVDYQEIAELYNYDDYR